MNISKIKIVAGIALLGSAGLWYVWHDAFSPALAAAPGGAPPRTRAAEVPVTVNVVTALRQDVPVALVANGTVMPLNTVDLRAQTSSLLKTVHIREGQFVRTGELLFTLDDRNDRANQDKANAQLARNQATLADLERQYRRSLELVAQKFISQGAADTLQMQVEAQQALVKSDQAGVQLARIATSYTTIHAPMAGRIGAINVASGSLIQPSTALASLTQINPILVSFTLPENSLQGLLEAQKRGPVHVHATLAGSDKAQDGQLSFIDNAVDPVAGTIRVKAQFDNRDTTLWPGQYVNTEISVNTLKDVVVVPLAAVVTGNDGKLVYAMQADQTARPRPVILQYTFGAQAVVSGLAEGEKIIVEGKQNLRPGSKVLLAQAPDGNPKDGGKKRQRQDAAKPESSTL